MTYGESLDGLITKWKRDLKTKAFKYVIHDDVVYKRAIDVTFMRCVDKEKQVKFLRS